MPRVVAHRRRASSMLKTPLACLAGFVMVSSSAVAAEAVDYLREVKPILVRHCVSCHGSAKPRGKLRLDTAAGAIRGGTLGPAVVPGEATESLLVLAVTGEGDIERMPLKRPPLTDREVATLRRWIDQGAKSPAEERPDANVPIHWAFVPPARPELPQVRDPAWGSNPIDRFLLARLGREGLAPAPQADRTTLIRRVSLDLVGLPPTLEEVDAFLADRGPDAYERLVDRLLASPHFGERWARPWLDLARYADSNGYSIDAPRSIWKYRDWVIDALNRNLPFDRFAIDQIAGDLHPSATLEEKVATGFHRNTPINQEGGIDLEQFRVEAVVDRVNTTATAFLGLTLGCAQCHDHKYDPISQREYYRFLAFFNNVDEPEIEFASPDQLARRASIRARIDAFHNDLEANHPALRDREIAWEASLSPAFRTAQTDEIKSAFDRPLEKRTKGQWRGLMELFLAQDGASKDLARGIAALRAQEPKFVTTMVVRERPMGRETSIHLGGDFTRKGEKVSPGVPDVLPGISSSKAPNRMDLARWLVDPRNPLTARVTINRLWQAYFGKGLVETENDFGTQGTPPSHPELLDWLAVEFVERGWDVKAMHRRIVTSMAYRQSSKARPDVDAIDPGHRLLARQQRLRLEAELVRDAALAASGLLSRKIGGPSVFPPQPVGVMTLGQMRREWTASPGPDRHRRGLYTFFWRATPHPSLMVFDAPNAIQACTRRIRSNTPLQALTLLNDAAALEFAEALAGRVLDQAPPDEASRIRLALRLCLAREPGEREARTLADLLDRERAEFASTMPDGSSAFAEAEDRRAWTAASRVLLNLDEFITRE